MRWLPRSRSPGRQAASTPSAADARWAAAAVPGGWDEARVALLEMQPEDLAAGIRDEAHFSALRARFLSPLGALEEGRPVPPDRDEAPEDLLQDLERARRDLLGPGTLVRTRQAVRAERDAHLVDPHSADLLHGEGLVAFLAGDMDALRRAAAALEWQRDATDASAALQVEHLDALHALGTQRFAAGAETLRALCEEPSLPSMLERASITASLEEALAAAEASSSAAGAAERAATLFAHLATRSDASLEDALAARVHLACARAARRIFTGELASPAEARELRALAISLAEPPVEPPPVLAAARLELLAWCAAVLLEAEEAGRLNDALLLADAVSRLLDDRPGSPVIQAALRRARLLERSGRARIVDDPAAGGRDLWEAAKVKLALAPAVRQEEARRLGLEAAELLDLAALHESSLAVLTKIGLPLGATGLLLRSRALVALGRPLEALDGLDTVVNAGNSRGGEGGDSLGPIKEEARLLRAASRLELSASLSPGRDEERTVLDRGAASDLVHLLEHLSPPSEVFRAALHLRGLALEREGLESLALVQGGQDEAGTGRHAAAERLEAAMEAFERELATADAWSAMPEEGREPVRGWVIAALDRLASIAERIGRLDVARDCLTRLSALGDSGSPVQYDGPRLRAILSFPPHETAERVASAGYRRGDLAFFQGDFELALEEYTSALTLHGTSPLAPWGHLRRGEIFRRKGDEAACGKELELLRFRLEVEEKTAEETAAGADARRRWRGALLSHLMRFESSREKKR